MPQAENLKSLPTQRSQKSLSPHQEQTYHVIPATVNQNPHRGNQSYVTNKTQTNLSIINRSQNQIPSMNHYQNKNHKQNQNHASLTNSKIDHAKDQKQNLTTHESKVNVEDKVKQHSQKDLKQIVEPTKHIQQKQNTENKNSGIKEIKNEGTSKQITSEQTNHAGKQVTNKENPSTKNVEAENHQDISKKQHKKIEVNQTPKSQQKQLKAHDGQLSPKAIQSKKTQIEQIKTPNNDENNKKQHLAVQNVQKEKFKQTDHHKKQPIIENKSLHQQISTHNQLYWSYLLNLFLQKVDKRKQQKQDKQQQHYHSHKHQKTDLNLQLGSSLISSQKDDDENRIKLEFKLYSPLQQTKENINNIQNHPVKLSFLLWDLHNKNSSHQTNVQTLQNKLQQITKHFDKSQFSYVINHIDKNNQVNKIKQELNKKKKKLRVDFSFSTDFISQQLSIDKHTFQELKSALLNLPSNHNDVKQITENNKNHHLLHTSFCELITSYPLKTIEPIKFLEFLLSGFKLRLFNGNHSNKAQGQTQTQSVEETLYEALLYLFPEQVCQYIRRVSGGNGKIKFRSIDNLTSLLIRLGIIQMLGETPTVKELLIELMHHFRTLFCINFESKMHDKKQQPGSTNKNKISQLWKIFDTIFHESNSHGLETQLILFNQMGIRLLLECRSHTINHLYQQLATN